MSGQDRGPHLTPSTTDSGFILQLPQLPNPATSDPTYTRVLQWYLPEPILAKVLLKLVKFGREAVSEEINTYIANAETRQPYVKSRNIWGEKYPHDRLVTSEGWRELAKWGSRNGSASQSLPTRVKGSL